MILKEKQIPVLPYPVYNFFININNGCNLRCSYCWYNATNNPTPFEEMSKQDFVQALSVIKESIILWKKNNHFFAYSKVKVAIATKEPLLSFNTLIKPVLDEFEFQDYFDIFLLTNGTLLTKEIIDWALDKNIVIQTSLDGCEKSHNTNRQFHSKIVENLKLIPNPKKNLFLVSTLDKNTIPYVKENLEFFKNNFSNTLIKFNFNIFNHWEDEDWNEVFKQYKSFIEENEINDLNFLGIYKKTPMFIDEGRGYIIGIDRLGHITIKKPFHSSIPKLEKNQKLLDSFNFGNIYNINYEDWIRYYQIMGRDFSKTRFENINGKCSNCEEKKYCFNCDYASLKTVYYLNDDECRLKIFKRKIEKMLNEKEKKNVDNDHSRI